MGARNTPRGQGYANIQALRAIAALTVVFEHLNVLFLRIGLTPFGGSGVDLFFIISGFIMVHSTAGRPITPVKFLARRIARIVPIYWGLTFTVFAMALLAPALLQATSADVVQLLKSLFFIPFEKSNGKVQPLLFLGWTLNYEMFFYALFALGLFLKDRRAGIFAVVAAIIAIVVAGLVLHPQEIIADFYTQPIILEFAAGMLLAVILPRLSLASRALWPALIAICSIALLVSIIAPFGGPETSRVLVRGIPAAIVLAVAVILDRSGATATNRFLLLLGNASYSIYLTHPYITQTAVKFFYLTTPDTSITVGLILAALLLAMVIGVIVHYMLELPLTRICTQLMLQRRPEEPRAEPN